MKVYTPSLRSLCIIGAWRTPIYFDVRTQTNTILQQVLFDLLLVTKSLSRQIKIHGYLGAIFGSLPPSFNASHFRRIIRFTEKIGDEDGEQDDEEPLVQKRFEN